MTGSSLKSLLTARTLNAESVGKNKSTVWRCVADL